MSHSWVESVWETARWCWGEVTCPGSRGEEDLPLGGFPHLRPSVLVDAVVAFSGCGGRLSLGCVLSAHAGSPVFTQCTVS